MRRAVLCDLFNTLVPGGDGELEALRADMAADLGADPELFSRLIRESWVARITGAMGDLETALRTLAYHAGARPTDSGVRLAAARRIELTRRLLWPRPATLAALDALRAGGWRLGLITNCTAEVIPLWKTTPLATRFDSTAFSCALGLAKPDPAIYLAACAALGMQPGDCVFVGDGADGELPAAAALGMTVIRTTEFVPAEGTWPPDRVESLTELAARLAPGVNGRRG